ncbi:hypothetical protein DYB30_000263 [Aphanomyces astaci]|uniref:Anaphase-promoting complex subunit 5 domain-containing protein n=1 Tax=Aphanomyces astaci TaxID=112090 RepID=A0A397CHD0_APHAT|nr:hypothetical protein DYB30_000263 [Aphanomyces astaci]
MHAQAISLYSQVLEVDPNERLFYKRYRAYLAERKYASALADLTSAVKFKPTYTQATGNFDKAVQSLTHAIDNYAVSSPSLLLQRAELNGFLGKTFDLIADTGSILRIEPGSLSALNLRGEAYYSLGDIQSLEAAVTHFRQGLQFDPEHKAMKALYKRTKKLLKLIEHARMAAESHQYAEAADDLEVAVGLDPSHSALNKDLNFKLCDAYAHLQKHVQAKAACAASLHVHEESADVHAKLGDVLINLEEYDEAVRHHRRAVELDENDRSVRHDAASEEATKKFQEAAEAYEILSNEARYDRGEDVTGNPQNQQQNPFHQGGNFHFHWG